MRLSTGHTAPNLFDDTIEYYRLAQWPSDAFLIGSPIRALLTGLLDREALTVGRLATLSGETVTSCREFLQDLEKEGAIEVFRETATPSDFPPQIKAATLKQH